LNDKNFCKEFNAFINKLECKENTTIVFENKDYHFFADNCIEEVIYMTNTCGENEMKIPTKKIGIMLKNLCNLTLDGNGAKLLYNGRMTEFVLQNCKNVIIKNFVIDFETPTVAEFEVVNKKLLYFDIKPNAEAGCSTKCGHLNFACKLPKSNFVIQENDLHGTTKRMILNSYVLTNPLFCAMAKTLKNGLVRIYLPSKGFKTGCIYQFCSVLRDGTGTFLDNCNNIELQNNTYHFMHGMGILAQLTKDITISNCNFVPNKKRTSVAFADLIHCSMCYGKISVTNCNFNGSRDDIINVHGNHFKVTAINNNVATVKFMHPQTYGFLGFFAGDTVDFINQDTLVPMHTNTVKSAKMLDKYQTEIVFENAIPALDASLVLENASKTASLFVDNIVGENIPTRGILVTTRQPVIIQNSKFIKTFMSAILVSDDAKSWYESGFATDVTIQNNEFIDCKETIINILPEAHTLTDKPTVHKNIKVLNNKFVTNHSQIANVVRTDGFIFENNTIISSKPPKFNVVDSKNVQIELL
ncbi:MAG: right-handed parallel beta-helix repeat-containing protein, partial [Clostridia bacterium]